MRYRRVLVLGAAGQLGWELARRCPALGETLALDRQALDLADASSVARAVRELRPELIVNAAAYTAVDRAEAEPAVAHALNAGAPGVLAEEARRLGALLIHYSTDYVFDGTASRPYREDDPPSPMSVYGRSKLDGERAIAASGATAIVLRTSWVYGLRGRNFLLTMQRLAGERDEIRVVDDQVGTPNWSGALAEATLAMLDRPRAELAAAAGLYHLTCRGHTTWCGFARAILRGSRARVVAISTDQYPTPARRPAYSVLDGQRLAETFGVVLPEWPAALARCLGTA